MQDSTGGLCNKSRFKGPISSSKQPSLLYCSLQPGCARSCGPLQLPLGHPTSLRQEQCKQLLQPGERHAQGFTAIRDGVIAKRPSSDR